MFLCHNVAKVRISREMVFTSTRFPRAGKVAGTSIHHVRSGCFFNYSKVLYFTNGHNLQQAQGGKGSWQSQEISNFVIQIFIELRIFKWIFIHRVQRRLNVSHHTITEQCTCTSHSVNSCCSKIKETVTTKNLNPISAYWFWIRPDSIQYSADFSEQTTLITGL